MKKKNLVMTAWGIYLRIIACVFIIIIGEFIIAPDLMSNDVSDIGVFFGIIVAFIAPAFAIWILFGIYKHFKNKKL